MHNQQQSQLEILILVDNFNAGISPITTDKSWGFNRFYMFTYIDICLDWISRLDSPNVIVAFSNQPDQVANQLQARWSYSIKKLQIITVQNCQSQNDVLREVEARHLLSGDFLLVQNCATFCSSNLANQIENFRLRRRQNKNNIVTLLYTEQKKIEKECDEFQQRNTIIGYHTATQKLVYYINNEISRRKLQLSKKNILNETIFRMNLKPSGLLFCAYEFSGHFAGNYDFHSFDDILHDILTNEEFLCSNIHIEVLPNTNVNELILSIDNFPTLIDVHRQLLERKCFPLTFDNVFGEFSVTGLRDIDQLQHYKARNLYVPINSTGRLDDLLKNKNLYNLVFGQNWKVTTDSFIESSTFGKCAQIGNDAFIQDSICGNNVKIGDRARVECSMLGDNVHIGADAIIGKYCFLGDNVEVLAGTKLDIGTVLMEGKQATKWHQFTTVIARTCNENDSILDDESSEEDENETTEPIDVIYQGNSRAFVTEVLESMQTVLEEHNLNIEIGSRQKSEISQEQIDNIKLEINGSKIANNISLDEMPNLLFYAFLSLPGVADRFADFKKQFNEWVNLWSIYFKRAASKMAMLYAIEEFATEHEKFQRLVPNVLHWLNQEEEFVSDEQILAWHAALSKDSPLHNVPKLAEFIEWLQKDEQSEEEEDGD